MRAIEINPNYASAHQWYAGALVAAGRFEESLGEIETAHDLDPLSPIINQNLADALYRNLRWEEALAQYAATLELDPAFAISYLEQSAILANLGRFDEALILARRARELNPASPLIAMGPANVLFLAREYDATLEEGLPVLEAFPDVRQTYGSGFGLFGGFVYTGRHDEALATVDRGSDLTPPPIRFLWDLARAFVAAHAGDRDLAMEYLDRAEEGRAQGPFDIWGLGTVGTVYALLGDHDRAFEWLERAYEENPGELAGMRVFPAYDPLRDDPRFDDLLRRMKLDDASLAWLDDRDAGTAP